MLVRSTIYSRSTEKEAGETCERAAAFATGLCVSSIYLDASILQSAGFAVVALFAVPRE
jgi:hypothetical protein